ncbi:phytoene/squalene synthase family protein [Aquincola tertiaricarbonis]|uniref:phytoene/squalene synthase family protein n=1 Tax=Aquincola tertiaricarbonis TaxID=391953 RepID=UPI000614DF9A|nr:phytoene/squalene synthase family protein [Aquincola tertiaricarbonis]
MPEPSSSNPPELSAADVAACRRVLRQHSRSFHAASLMLPRTVRDPASVLYGFCRLADDAVDVHGGQAEAIARLQERLARAAAGRPLPQAADRALAAVLRAHAIPLELPVRLLEGLAWDAEGRRYETLDDLLHYAARVAGTVGAMMCLLMDVRSHRALARACDLGVAMQLSNIARDVGEDARMGRLYLPLQWLHVAGIDADAWLAAPRHSPALAGVVERLLRQADLLYARADAGIAMLPVACRPGIRAARRLYAEIGQQVRRAGCDAVGGRAVVPPLRKAVLLAGAAWPGAGRGRRAAAGPLPPLAATRGLVEAAARPVPRRRGPVDTVLDLFERLERRDRFGSAG